MNWQANGGTLSMGDNTVPSSLREGVETIPSGSTIVIGTLLEAQDSFL